MRQTPEEEPEFQIAPMIDILLVLLVFFMSIASTEVLQTNDHVRLPVAKDAADKPPEGKDKGQTIINVLWGDMAGTGSGSIEIDEQKYVAPADVEPVLLRKVSLEPTTKVLVRADKEVKYEYMRALLVSIGKAGVANVTFAVTNKDTAGAEPEGESAP